MEIHKPKWIEWQRVNQNLDQSWGKPRKGPMKIILGMLAVLMVTGCMSTRVALSPKWNRSTPPVYIDYMDYYLLGLVGHPSLDLNKICMDQQPLGLQKIKTVEDSIITAVTLGIYSPLTVKVWCGG